MTSQGYAQPDLLVETDWLEAHLDDPNIRIVDCDPFDSYRRAHIKNAVGIRVHHYIKQPEYDNDPKNYPLVASSDTMKEVMESMGIGDDNLVIAYDSNGSLWSSRFWWSVSVSSCCSISRARPQPSSHRIEAVPQLMGSQRKGKPNTTPAA